MNDTSTSQNDSDDRSLRQEFIAQFDDADRKRTETSLITIGQTHLTRRDAEHWGGKL